MKEFLEGLWKENKIAVFYYIFLFFSLVIIFLSLLDLREEKKEIVKESFSSSIASSVSSQKEEKPVGKVLSLQKRAVVIRKDSKDFLDKGEIVYSDSTIISEDSPLSISNRSQMLEIEKGSKIYIGKESISLLQGELKVEGRININVKGKKVYGEGVAILKVKEGEIQVALYEGSLKIKASSEVIELKSGEGIIIDKDSKFDPPFKLPTPPEDIKVKVY